MLVKPALKLQELRQLLVLLKEFDKSPVLRVDDILGRYFVRHGYLGYASDDEARDQQVTELHVITPPVVACKSLEERMENAVDTYTVTDDLDISKRMEEASKCTS